MNNIVAMDIYLAKQAVETYLYDNPEHIVINFHKTYVSLFCQNCFHQQIINTDNKDGSILNLIGNFVNEHEEHIEVDDIEDESENIEFIGEDFGVYKSRRNKKSDDTIKENIIPFKKRSC